jgi:hypothetical protein
MVQFLPRCCGLFSITSSVLLFDVTTLAPTWVTRAIPLSVSSSFKTLAKPFTAIVSAANGIVPFQAQVGAGLKVYTTSVAGKSLCDRFADTVGIYIDYAAASVLVYQIVLDLGAAAYMIRFKELPPINGYTTSCLKLFSKDQATDIIVKSAPVSESDKITVAQKVDEAFRQDARVKLGEFEKEEDRILEESAKTTLGQAGLLLKSSVGVVGSTLDTGGSAVSKIASELYKNPIAAVGDGVVGAAKLSGNAINYIGKSFGLWGGKRRSPRRRSPRLLALKKKKSPKKSPKRKSPKRRNLK